MPGSLQVLLLSENTNPMETTIRQATLGRCEEQLEWSAAL